METPSQSQAGWLLGPLPGPLYLGLGRIVGSDILIEAPDVLADLGWSGCVVVQSENATEP
jgi:hypothetical protein